MGNRRKGVKSAKGQSMMGYHEVKERTNITITSTAKNNLDAVAAAFNISRSELIEWYGRSLGQEQFAIPKGRMCRILREYAEELLLVILKSDDSSLKVACYIHPPSIWLHFNQLGDTGIYFYEPKATTSEEWMELKKGRDIFAYSNVNAYLDGCSVTEILNKRNKSRE